VQQLGAYFDRSPFRARFEDKGRFSRYVSAIPTFVITAEQSTFNRRLGDPGFAAARAARRARLGHPDPDPPCLQRVVRRPNYGWPNRCWRIRARCSTSPSPRSPAARRSASPTVIRFCRSLGCEGSVGLKLRLASGLTGTVPITHVQVDQRRLDARTRHKVLGNTASAILQVRKPAQPRDDRPHGRIVGPGPSGRVLHRRPVRAAWRWTRSSIPALRHPQRRHHRPAPAKPWRSACSSPATWRLIISNGGPPARDAGAGRHGEGARCGRGGDHRQPEPVGAQGDTVLTVDHGEDAATQVPMVSRILQLLMIDILTVGVALRRPSAGATDEAAAGPPVAAAAGAGPLASPPPLSAKARRRHPVSARPRRCPA